MANTIESFVEKLQVEGVQVGQQEAQKIRSQAQQEAEEIIQKANEQAEKIIEDAQAKTKNIFEKSQTELQLAVRDTILRLRQILANSLRAVLVKPVEEQLANHDFLANLLREIILEYVRADCKHHPDIKINVSPQTYNRLAEWAIGELRKSAEEEGASVDLKGTLAQAGFEYQVTEGNVEVTVDSVVDTLAKLTGPRLREILISAISKD